EMAPPFVLGGVEDGTGEPDTRVVHHDVGYAAFGDHGVDECAHGLAVGDVDPVGRHLDTEPADLVGRLGEGAGVDVDEHQLGAFPRELQCGGAADPLTRAGDHDQSTVESALRGPVPAGTTQPPCLGPSFDVGHELGRGGGDPCGVGTDHPVTAGNTPHSQVRHPGAEFSLQWHA